MQETFIYVPSLGRILYLIRSSSLADAPLGWGLWIAAKKLNFVSIPCGSLEVSQCVCDVIYII
jgi:Ni/Fe-hydrogenase subunit HybB-like protein